MAEAKSIYAALIHIQHELKAPKSKQNTFGKYSYRSAEDILEAVKPLLNETGLILTLTDDIEEIAGRVYVKATARLIDIATGEVIENHAYAREPQAKKGADDAQITGATSSYARKYAMNGLFAIDDTKDPDTDEYRRETTARQTAQNGAGARSQSNPNNYTQQATDAHQQATQAVMQAAKTNNIDTNVIKAIISVKFAAGSSKDLTADQLNDIAQNITKYAQELEA